MATIGTPVAKRPLSSNNPQPETNRRGLAIDAQFCPADVADPFDTVQWDLRVAAIKGENGEVLFEQENCEVPAFWIQLATNVVVSKYFYGEVNTPEREHSVKQLIHRVCRTIADWGLDDGYFASEEDAEHFYRDLTWLCLHQHGAFNSPVWFNVGLYHQYGVKGAQCNWHWNRETDTVEQPENPYEYPQGSACFIQSVRDNMEDIMELARSEAMLFKFGSGTGTDLSTLRSHREKLSGGGKPSGPLSFMRVYDQIAAVVKSGGKTRRAAKMQSLKVWHPDIMEFIECKAKEEQKARLLIEKGGYEANFNGEAYSSILFQNANLSVRVTDDFMQAVVDDKEWTTHWVTEKDKAGPSWPARDVLAKMAECAWACGDPGVQYDTTINRWNTCPNSGRINASNPCSEYMFLDDTACNLASINLMKFRQADGTFDAERFQAACRLFFIAQEILVDHASYPTKRIAENSHRFRPLGLGYSNLGSLIMSGGLAYDSDAARGVCGAMTALLHGAANLTSAELAAAVGPFDGYDENREPMLNVMQMHRDAVGRDQPGLPALSEASGPNVVGRGARGWSPPRVPQCPGHGAGSDRHDQLPDGLRHHGHRAGHRAGEVQATGRRRHAEDRQPDGAAWRCERWATTSRRSNRSWRTSIAKTRSKARPNSRTSTCGVFDCAFQPRNGSALDRLAGARADDGRRPAVPVGGDLQDGEHAARDDAGRHRRRLSRRLATGAQGPGRLSRRLEGKPAAVDQHRDGQGRGQASGRAAPRTAARHAQERDAQVQHLGPRGLYHRRAVRRRAARRVVHHDGQGRQHDRRTDGLLRHGRVDEPAVRRAARGVRQQVLAHAVRADGAHEEPRHSHRQEHRRLHLPLAGHEFLPGYREAIAGENNRRRGPRCECRGGHGARAQARRQEGRRAAAGARSGRSQDAHRAKHASQPRTAWRPSRLPTPICSNAPA